MKEKNKISLSGKISAYICPIMLGTAVCYAVMDVLYKSTSAVYSVIFALAAWMFFGLFDRLKNLKRLGGLLYMVIFSIVSSASMWILRVGMWRSGGFKEFMKWFFGETEQSYDQPYFLNFVFIAGGFFLISVMYYFTQVRYRSLGVMLCTLFPFVIYTKRSAIMPELMTTVIVVMYLAVIVHNRHIDPSRPQVRTVLKTDRSYIIAIAVFVSVTGTLTILMPKPTYASLLEIHSDLLSYTNTIGGGGDGTSDGVSQTSSSLYGDRNNTGKVLFYFLADESTGGDLKEYYLRKQVFDNFNGEVWEKDMNNINRYFYTERYPEYEMKDLVNDFYYAYGREDVSLPEIKMNVSFVEGEDFSAQYIPCPLGTSIKTVTEYYKKYLDGRLEKIYYTDSNLSDAFKFYEQDGNLYEYARQIGLSSEQYAYVLEVGYDDEKIRKIYSDYLMAYQLYSDQYEISEKIYDLAWQITKDCHSDIEKAVALEKYFEENGYVYDESYVPEDTSIEYFIFEGKTGICTGYATAMTLMARSVGLTARYVEGYAAFEKDDMGRFVIRDSYAHAFVEVYIPAVGWMTFDPTVSGYMQIHEEQHDYWGNILQFLSHFIVVIAVAVIIMLVWLRDRFAEVLFRISQLFGKPEKRVLKLYANVIKLTNFSTGEKFDSYTVNMLREYLHSTRGTAPEKLFCLFEKTAFGEYEPTLSDYRDAYREYRKCYRFLRKIPKKKL